MNTESELQAIKAIIISFLLAALLTTIVAFAVRSDQTKIQKLTERVEQLERAR